MTNCIMCKATLSSGVVNHVVDINGQIIILKNVSADVCQQCGEYYIDHQTALKLELMVEEAKKSGAEISIINFRDKVA